jgi:autotransporter passenger strand-loop-strand repeat protein
VSGSQVVSSGGTASNTTVSGGTLEILSGGTASATTIGAGGLLDLAFVTYSSAIVPVWEGKGDGTGGTLFEAGQRVAALTLTGQHTSSGFFLAADALRHADRKPKGQAASAISYCLPGVEAVRAEWALAAPRTTSPSSPEQHERGIPDEPVPSQSYVDRLIA